LIAADDNSAVSLLEGFGKHEEPTSPLKLMYQLEEQGLWELKLIKIKWFC
jgi:hypothetical protein